MFVTNSFVFVHLHKSGGTFVNAFLRQFFPRGRRMRWHLPRTHIPPAARSLPILGVVRNPWDYYVSWFTFQSGMRKREQNTIYRTSSDNGTLGFVPTITNLVNLWDDPKRFEIIRSELPDEFVNHGINLTKACVDSLPGSGLGFYSFLFQRMYGDAKDVTFARMESLRTDLLAFFERVGVVVTPEMRDHILNSEKKNVTKHAPFPSYYDAGLRDLVGVRDRAVIERFGYTFPED